MSRRINVRSNTKDPNAIDPNDLINLGKLLRIGRYGYPSSKYQIATAEDTIYFSEPEININNLD